MALIGGGFYLGSQSIILGRGPASPMSQLKKAFSSSEIRHDGGLHTLMTSDGDSICSALDGVEKYKVVVQAAGVSISDHPAELIITGDCFGKEEVVVFEDALCNRSLEQINDEAIEGRSFQAINFPAAINKLSFFLSSLEITYKGEDEKETVTPPLNKEKNIFSCSSN